MLPLLSVEQELDPRSLPPAQCQVAESPTANVQILPLDKELLRQPHKQR